jgi:hypothetical protein
LAYLAYLAEDFRSQRSDVLRANKNLLYGDFEGLFTSQNLLPGKKNFFSREEIEFLLDEKKFSSCKKKFFREILLYGQIKPGNGDSFSFRKSSFDLVRGHYKWDFVFR